MNTIQTGEFGGKPVHQPQPLQTLKTCLDARGLNLSMVWRAEKQNEPFSADMMGLDCF